jgi:hypothetical protein
VVDAFLVCELRTEMRVFKSGRFHLLNTGLILDAGSLKTSSKLQNISHTVDLEE